jgi:hypothetical protein
VRRMHTFLTLTLMSAAILVATNTVIAETFSDCLATRANERKTARATSDREAAACSGERQCVKDAQAKWNSAAKHIDDEASACKARVQSQTKAEPPPYLNWKPGDPSPQAKDGRRYIMSCSGKVLGMYKPGGAVEMELKTHPGNCFPNDDPWLRPQPGTFGTSEKNYCYERGTGSHKEYSGSKPDWCR